MTLPDDWLGEIAQPQRVEPAEDVTALVNAALRQPIGSPPLESLVRRGQRIAVIVDDYTRKTPTHLILPSLLRTLESCGAKPENICIVIAPGSHRLMREAEVIAKLGEEVIERYAIVHLPATAEEDMLYLGTASNGIPAWVNRHVAEADLRIGVGMITPHMDAGFSGGAKIILPGVCSRRTVEAFHAASIFVPGNQVGNVDTPLRLNLEKFVSERIPLHFIVNIILTKDGDIYQCVAGDAIQAHRQGVKYAREVFGAPIQRRYPVVIANCYPYDIDWWQSTKGVWGGDLMTADGGEMIVVAAAPEGNSNYPLVPVYMRREAEEVMREIETGTAQDVNQAALAALCILLRQRVNLSLVSQGLTRSDAEAMCMPYFDTVEDAVAAAVQRLPGSQRRGAVGVLPMAGVTLPISAFLT